jgi:acetyl esterase/lipase
VGSADAVRDGFIVASINYRLSLQAPFPAQIHDCKGAVRWLRAHATEYGIDPTRIGVFGASAGGHLVALLGTSAGDAALEGIVGGNLDQSSAVQAVCDWFGPTDMSRLREELPSDNAFAQHPEFSPVAGLFGGIANATPKRVQQANPIAYVDKSDPPFLIMHGDHDKLVPMAQSELLADALKRAGVPCDFKIVKNAGHGQGFAGQRGVVRDFFVHTLRDASVRER